MLFEDSGLANPGVHSQSRICRERCPAGNVFSERACLRSLILTYRPDWLTYTLPQENEILTLSGFKPKTVKAKALQLCHGLDLTQLRKQITAAKGDHLEMFFSAKTHNDGCPFRVIVTERGSWQGILSRFLLGHLSKLQLNDSFLISN